MYCLQRFFPHRRCTERKKLQGDSSVTSMIARKKVPKIQKVAVPKARGIQHDLKQPQKNDKKERKESERRAVVTNQ
ncbi:hypothetical protein L210DRAFT_3542040 [Boletus edulis BED1]|uniref:Uncharacterized protein n=1 Tax=Boletus edulis BED1 TaxID=1328754 RepID=A0AAD4BU78_BOLED|nr:hypothetical protein L210DRAFT_3542040 [Boletus edulis BED1]